MPWHDLVHLAQTTKCLTSGCGRGMGVESSCGARVQPPGSCGEHAEERLVRGWIQGMDPSPRRGVNEEMARPRAWGVNRGITMGGRLLHVPRLCAGGNISAV